MEHFTDPEDVLPGGGEGDEKERPNRTTITLSEPPAADMALLEVYRPDSFFTQHGFDLPEIEYILGVLENGGELNA